MLTPGSPPPPNPLRSLTIGDAAGLPPGAEHYRAFVGPPARYDIIGASQMALLHLLGLRDHHSVLDFGCGSLRLGRMLIPYLQAGGYFGIDPNAWLVEDGLDRELGRDAAALKRPRFDHNSDYRADVFDGQRFDFIIAQSIFTHTGYASSLKILQAFAGVLKPGGLAVINWYMPNDNAAAQAMDWVYPGLVEYSAETIARLAATAGLALRPTPWPHPAGLRWDLLALTPDRLPTADQVAGLRMTPLQR